VLLYYAVNIFGYRTVEDEVKDGKCMVSRGWCIGPQSKTKYDFSLGNVFRPLNFTILRNSLATIFLRLFPVGISEV
jgi:hypothetical protein